VRRGSLAAKWPIYLGIVARRPSTRLLGIEDDINLYAYVGNDPLNDTDPTGEDCADPSTGPCEEVVVTARKPQQPAEASTIAPLRPVPVVVPLPSAGTVAHGFGWGVIIDFILNGACDAPPCKGSNTMASKAEGDPPVPGAKPGRETKGRTSQWKKPGGQAKVNACKINTVKY
jgi:hypothetical protein